MCRSSSPSQTFSNCFPSFSLEGRSSFSSTRRRDSTISASVRRQARSMDDIKLKSWSRPAGVRNWVIGMKARGLRWPSQSARVLCFWMHWSEQVRALHCGHLYFGGSIWQMLHSLLRTVSDMTTMYDVLLLSRAILRVSGGRYFSIDKTAYRPLF